MRFVSRSVVTGFVNALAILIFLAQLPELIGMPWPVYAVCAAALAIIYGLPRITRVVPSPLVAIVVLTIVSIAMGLQIRTVGDMGQLPSELPRFGLPDVPFTWDTLRLLLPISATLTVVGLLESLMTAQIVEDVTDTPTNRRRECAGQGAANIVAGFFGGMAGCAMIGQSMINVTSGGRGRLSCLVAGVVLLLLVVYASAWVGRIPMAALVAVMIMVSIGTFQWRSFADMRTHPKSATIIMLGTVVVTVATHDLAKGVLTGVLITALSFARRASSMLRVDDRALDDGTRVYEVRGEVFFASAAQFGSSFDFVHAPARVIIDLTHAHFWDLSAVGALDRVVLKLRAHGASVDVVGLNAASETLVERVGTHRDEGAHLQAGH
jgi:SulP family sulfate permease